jgi:hypothetical protein
VLDLVHAELADPAAGRVASPASAPALRTSARAPGWTTWPWSRTGAGSRRWSRARSYHGSRRDGRSLGTGRGARCTCGRRRCGRSSRGRRCRWLRGHRFGWGIVLLAHMLLICQNCGAGELAFLRRCPGPS